MELKLKSYLLILQRVIQLPDLFVLQEVIMAAKPVINIAGTVCPPEADERFNRWYDDKHIPMNLKFEGLTGVTRYRMVRSNGDAAVQKYPRYVTIYRLKDLAAFAAWNTSPELAAATQFTVQGALQKWLGDLITVQAVEVESRESTLKVTVRYVSNRTQEPQTVAFSQTMAR